ncbi:MAG: chemotaxis protein CheX [Spirochaetes bacterium]|nr:chemotaxis protein CheX [Spirochaetota bacterium]
MRLEYINPFAEAAYEIMGTYLKDDIRISDVTLREGVTNISGVGIVIGITGNANGNVLLDMDETVACKIASAMTETEIFNVSPAAVNALKELANMVSASAVTKISKIGRDLNVTPPAVVQGKSVSYQSFQNESLLVKIDIANIGHMDIFVAIVDN